MKKIIKTDKAPAAIGPYSQAVEVGNLIYTSGQIPISPKTGDLVSGDIKKATAQCIENLKAIAEAAGCTLNDVVKTTVFLKDMNQFTEMNEVYGSYFVTDQPARSCVQAAKLPRDVDVEIEAIILKK
ncbi:2-iminobutanoate/2-iminopropanoate deaminase [Oxobacter pfennigii]|uniref:2-iminobutanoate/2-iminopropanoate deaminase n=1 Tax=Oxobacter pfennigii TaxID=36849 RepID=A0A0P8YAV1_9CLOT|nr:RidA family protein [Oxobacter pfennigii]KPU44157.1 2-iminobutanoate/2-iminopropanoate deaminase [Oxobacter pfennigii]